MAYQLSIRSASAVVAPPVAIHWLAAIVNLARPRQHVSLARLTLDQVAFCLLSALPASLFFLVAMVRFQALLGLLGRGAPTQDPVGQLWFWLLVGQDALPTAFTGLVAGLFVIRRRPLRGRHNRRGDLAAIAGSLIVMALVTAPRTANAIPVLVLSEFMMALGMGVTVVALLSLGRCFGVMPRARGLVRRGLYRYVRHPMYLGEFIAFGGMLLAAITPYCLAVFVAFVGLQLYRIHREELTLAAAFPEYFVYRATTRRLLPGLY